MDCNIILVNKSNNFNVLKPVSLVDTKPWHWRHRFTHSDHYRLLNRLVDLS